MPTYEYECPKCGHFERFQSINDDPLKRCPTCRRKVEKLISGGNFHLKGGGWYSDGYDKKGSSSDSSSSSSSESTAGSSSSGGSDKSS